MARRQGGNALGDRLLVHPEVFGALGCRHCPVYPGGVSEGGFDSPQRITRLPPPRHTPTLGVRGTLSRTSLARPLRASDAHTSSRPHGGIRAIATSHRPVFGPDFRRL